MLLLAAPRFAHADEIPIVTLTEVGPNQEIPTHRSFYVSGDAPATDDNAHQYKVLVPHDREFFADGYGYCLFVVATERAQEIDDTTLSQLVDGVARKVVECGDKSSCDDDAFIDFATHAERELASSRLVAAGPVGEAKLLAA